MGLVAFVRRTPCAGLLAAQVAGVLLAADRTWTELLFLSFTTLSSTGLSDIVPISGHARSVVMIEQVAGLFCIAMVVTRLVGLNAARSPRGPRS